MSYHDWILKFFEKIILGQQYNIDFWNWIKSSDIVVIRRLKILEKKQKCQKNLHCKRIFQIKTD